MSTTKFENNSDEENSDFALENLKDIKNWKLEQVYDYIEQLHHILERKNKKLIKYKQKYKKLLQKCEEENESCKNEETPVQADETGADKASGEAENEMTASTAFSFVDEMRQVAAQAQNLNDFVYEPTSGLYYDQKSGYYYNAEYGLYYDGNTGCYYSYDQTKQAFEFHSQVEVQPTAAQKTAAADANEQYADGDVEFDEWGGVITDPQKLQQIKEEKQKREEAREKYKKKSKKQKEKEERKEKKRMRKHKKRRKHSRSDESARSSDSDSERNRKQVTADVEDGELSSSASSSGANSNSGNSDDGGERQHKANVKIFKSGSRFQDIAKKYPPSLRIVVQETNLEQLKVGSLRMITYKGGSLGREGNHDVIVPDVNVSKFHLKFMYDHKQGTYKCTDLGSRNGTILNGKRMSSSKTESAAYALVHGSVLQIGQTKLLCHVHEGNSTCGLCEPGLLIEKPATSVKTQSTESVVLTHKEQLKKLQKKYGLENEKFVDGGKAQSATGNYNDRAATRRVQVGSTTDKEKTQIASVDTEIPSENKGFKMLAKLGWNKGETLGKSNVDGGLLEPINVTSNEGTKGLGCEAPATGMKLTAADKRKLATLKKTQERYQKSADMFVVSDDSD